MRTLRFSSVTQRRYLRKICSIARTVWNGRVGGCGDKCPNLRSLPDRWAHASHGDDETAWDCRKHGAISLPPRSHLCHAALWPAAWNGRQPSRHDLSATVSSRSSSVTVTNTQNAESLSENTEHSIGSGYSQPAGGLMSSLFFYSAHGVLSDSGT